MIWSEDMKELETSLSHWEKISKEYGPEINVQKPAMIILSRD
jgi:hypothetical protein